MTSCNQLNSPLWSSGEGSGLREPLFGVICSWVRVGALCLGLKSQEKTSDSERDGNSPLLRGKRVGHKTGFEEEPEMAPSTLQLKI